MAKRYTVVGLGELLWDLLPAGKQLGGAPANFAYITRLFDDEGIPASRLGPDLLGREASEQLHHLGLRTDFIQDDTRHPTGTVHIEIDATGQPRFEIREFVAWDFLEWTPQWQQLAVRADAVCFGSLAQRSAPSRATIRSFLQAMKPDTVRVFDVNLRQNFFTPEILAESMKLATIVKLNHDELPRIAGLFGIPHHDEESSARKLIELYGLKLVCVTRGNSGSLLVSESERATHPGFPVKVADTVGAGDAFTAALVHEYLREKSLACISETANRVGAWVATQVGAMPVPPDETLRDALAKVG